MPLINMPLDALLRLVKADGEIIVRDEVPDRLHDMGVEVEEVTDTMQYVCKTCGEDHRTDRGAGHAAGLHELRQ